MMSRMRRTIAALLFALSAMTASLPHTHHSLVTFVFSGTQLAASEARPVLSAGTAPQHEVCVACTRDQQRITQATVTVLRVTTTRDAAPPRLVAAPRSADLPLALLRAPPAVA